MCQSCLVSYPRVCSFVAVLLYWVVNEEGTTEGEELEALRVEEETVEPDVRVRGHTLARGSPRLHKLKRVSSAKW